MPGSPRKYYAKESETLADSATTITNLDINSPISAIDLLYEATTGASSGRNHYLHQDVSRIEVVDGSDVLYSLNMKDGMAVNCYAHKKFPYMSIDERASTVNRETVRINFGRFLGDPEYYLNPNDFTNLQLKETHALTIASDSGYGTGTGVLSVIVHLMEGDLPAPKAFLMNKEVFSYTSAASGVQIIELPDDYPIRAMFLHSLEANVAIDTDLSRVKMSLGMDKFIPFDTPIDHLISEMADNFGVISYGLIMYCQNDDAHDLLYGVPLAIDTTNLLSSASILEVSATLVSMSGNRASFQVTEHNTASILTHLDYATDSVFHTEVAGYLPMNTFCWLFAPVGNEDWSIDVLPWKKGQVRITDGGAGASNRLLLQQFRSK